MLKILQNKNPKEEAILRAECIDVKKNEFGSKELLKIIQDMKIAMENEPDGVAIAAPQIGINKKIFIISEKAYDEKQKLKPLVFINPQIIKQSKKQEIKEEGCLSVRGIWGKTLRSTQVTVKAYNEMGVPFSYGASGLIAHIIQHEMDHLDGVLFIDHGFEFGEYDPYAQQK